MYFESRTLFKLYFLIRHFPCFAWYYWISWGFFKQISIHLLKFDFFMVLWHCKMYTCTICCPFPFLSAPQFSILYVYCTNMLKDLANAIRNVTVLLWEKKENFNTTLTLLIFYLLKHMSAEVRLPSKNWIRTAGFAWVCE